MQELFCRLLEMSLRGVFCIGVAVLIRLLLVRLGRKYAYYLWAVVFLNLIVPVTIQGKFSLIPKQAAEVSVEVNAETGRLSLAGSAIPLLTDPAEETEEISGGRRMEERRYPDHSRKARKESGYGGTISVRFLLDIWILGLAAILLFNVVHIVRMKRQISPDRRVYLDDREGIAEVRGLAAPFLWGILRPVILLPAGLEETERALIIMHESCHRKRRDPLFKLAAFGVAAVHWFNPAVWIAWMLFCRDMEISCDEAILAGAGRETRSRYAQSILRYAAMQNGYLVTPPTFGEPSAKMRVKNALQYREHGPVSGWVAGSIMIMAVLGLTVHPAGPEVMSELSEYVDDIVIRNSDVAKAVGNGIREVLAAAVWPDFAEDQLEEWHREGYVEAAVTHVPLPLYYTPGLWDQNELDNLAQRALQELYDLTGFQVESCVYGCSDLGTFFFAKTEEDLIRSRNFYMRSYGEKEGYGSNTIPCMDIVNARRVWFSDVQQLEIPDGIESMGEEELAVWFLKNSSLYQGEEIVDTELAPELAAVRIIAEDGSFYEVALDMPIQAVSSIYGPYPEGASH